MEDSKQSRDIEGRRGERGIGRREKKKKMKGTEMKERNLLGVHVDAIRWSRLGIQGQQQPPKFGWFLS